MDSAQEFFFVDGAGSQCGPVTAATLKEYWAGGYVNDTTYAFASDGSTANWTPIAQLPELLAFCTSAAPPAPRTAASRSRGRTWRKTAGGCGVTNDELDSKH